jgi:hypothetical protein
VIAQTYFDWSELGNCDQNALEMELSMSMTHFMKRVLRSANRRIEDAHSSVQMRRLNENNCHSHASVVRLGGPVISLTSYGKRIQTVHYTIESIASGTVLPSRLILWLDDKAAYDTPTPALLRLVARGLEIELCENYGPHTKYYPYVESEEKFLVPVVTADDDVIYPRHWIERLADAFRLYPDVLNCYLAKTITLENNSIGRYVNWKINRSTLSSYLNVAHGVNGVLYPPSYLMALKQAGDGFKTCCPKADDLWLHVQALRAGYKIRQIKAKAQRFPTLPGTQEGGLWVSNHSGGNDLQAKATYTSEDIEILRSDHIFKTEP